MEEDNYKCPRCGSKLFLRRHLQYFDKWECTNMGCTFTIHKRTGESEVDSEPQEELERNFFADCSTTEALAWQYIGWTGAILNDSLFKRDNHKLADLKEALEHFKKRWEEILNEEK